MILDPTLTAAYLIVATALAISPGPDVLFVIANGMKHRVGGAIAAAFGIAAGSLGHAIAAAVGISAIIAASPVAFDVLRYGGAIYLAYLGLQALRSFFTPEGVAGERKAGKETTVWKVFQRGFVTNILNPKVIVFYLALLPQFISLELGNVGLQIFLLGCIHNAIGLAFLVGVGLAAGKAAERLFQSQFGKWLEGIAGLFFIGLALRLAFSEKPGT